MTMLYEQLIDLLGKPRSVNERLFADLVRLLGNRPSFYAIKEHRFYDFNEAGISLYFDDGYGIFTSVNLHIRTAGVREGSVNRYAGNLPFGITIDDSEQDVEAKLPGGMMAVKDYRFDVDLRPLIVTFSFGTPDFQSPGVGRREMTMVAVSYEDALHPIK
jgi:hypothetical protein